MQRFLPAYDKNLHKNGELKPVKGPGLFPRELSLGSEEKGLLPFSRRHEYGVISGILRLTGRYNCFSERNENVPSGES